jgi:hypothetical protein
MEYENTLLRETFCLSSQVIEQQYETLICQKKEAELKMVEEEQRAIIKELDRVELELNDFIES